MDAKGEAPVTIGRHRLDLGRGLLLEGERVVHLRAKTFQLLSYLARNRGRVLSKDELMAALWPGLTVTDDSLTQTVKDLRRALGEPDAGLVRTVARRGYVLEAAQAGEGRARLPRIVVPPFGAKDLAPGDRAILDGIAEELTLGLARYGLLEVVARHTAFRARPEGLAAAVAEDLGADYYVEGQARRQGAELTLAVGLVASESGRQLWGERIELDAGAVPMMQETVPHRIVTRLTLDAERRIGLRGAGSRPATMDAWGHFLAGVAALRDTGSGVNEAGKAHLKRALALDPGFALAHAYLALAEVIIGDYGAAPPEVLQGALDRVREAQRLAPEESRCHWVAGIIQLYRGEFVAAEISLRQAKALNPGDPDVMMLWSFLLASRGKAEEALVWAERAMAVNPLHPNWYHHDVARVMTILERHEEALAHMELWAKESAARSVRMAASHAMLGQREEAARCLREMRRLRPDWDPMAEADAILDLELAEDRARFRAMIAAALETERADRGQG